MDAEEKRLKLLEIVHHPSRSAEETSRTFRELEPLIFGEKPPEKPEAKTEEAPVRGTRRKVDNPA